MKNTLTPVEAEIYKLLKSKRLITREEVREHCGMTDVYSNAVDIHVSSIRRKLKLNILAVRKNRFRKGGYSLQK